MRRRRERKSESEAVQPSPKDLRPGFAARMRNYFLAGVLVTAPVGITFWIAWNLVEFIDDSVMPLVPRAWNPETYLPFSLPGIGLIVAVVILILIGFATAGFLGRTITAQSERILARVPVVRSVYSATKQLFETVLAQKSTAFRQVALIEYPSRGVWAVGFVTGETVGEVQDLTDDTTINVFVPATPNPTTGFLLFVPNRDVHVLDMTVEEGIKLVISGGIIAPPEREGAPRAAAVPASDLKPAKKRTGKGIPSRRFRLVARLRNYFLAGILITAPIGITVWLTWKFITFVDDLIDPYIPPWWHPETYLPFDIPGLGLIFALIGLIMIGMFAAGFTGRMLMRTSERILAQVPVIRSLYGGVKQVLHTVLAQQATAFRKVVLFQYPRPGVWAIGFLTGQAERHIQATTAEDEVINVFLPTTPNPTSGFLLFVPKGEAQELTMTVEEGLKMVVSGGIVTPDDRREEKPASEPKTPEPRQAAEPRQKSLEPVEPGE